MAKFLTDLNVKCIDDGQWELAGRLVYESDLVGPIIVDAGFQTDFASVPRVPVAYMLFGDRAHREAVLHDYLYRVDAVPTVDRVGADRVFLEAMKCRGKGYFVRYAMWMGVRAGGWAAYHKRNVGDKL